MTASCSATRMMGRCGRSAMAWSRRRRPGRRAGVRRLRGSRTGWRGSAAKRPAVFKRVLEGIRDRVEGALAISLIGLDGIAIESLRREGVPLEAMGAEFGSFVKSVRVSDTEFQTGDVQQLSLVTDRNVMLLSALTEGHLVLL